MLEGSMRKDHMMNSEHPSGLHSGQGSPKAGAASRKTPNRNRRLVDNQEMSNRMQQALAQQQQQ